MQIHLIGVKVFGAIAVHDEGERGRRAEVDSEVVWRTGEKALTNAWATMGKIA
jgi:hypothetical protein